jgi:hypothetical protein
MFLIKYPKLIVYIIEIGDNEITERRYMNLEKTHFITHLPTISMSIHGHSGETGSSGLF